MIIVVKGKSNVGKSSFSRRLAASLQLKPPVWPVDREGLVQWEQRMTGWAEGAPGYIDGTGHIDTDRLIGLFMYRHSDKFPLPPMAGDGVSRDTFRRWRDGVAPRVFVPPLFDELFALLCGMIESTDHTIVEGTLMGTSRVDSLVTRMLKFKYAKVPFVDIVARRVPYDGPTMPAGIEVVRHVIVNGRAYDPDDVIRAFHRTADGNVVFDRLALPATVVSPAAAQEVRAAEPAS